MDRLKNIDYFIAQKLNTVKKMSISDILENKLDVFRDFQ